MDIVSGILDTLASGLKLVKPVVDESFAQKYSNEHKSRMEVLEGILAAPDSDERALAFAAFVRMLHLESGTPAPARIQNEPLVGIRVSELAAILNGWSEGIRLAKTLNRVEFKSGS